jgi:hypothetical protein
MNYILEIYMPGSRYDVAIKFEAAFPFMTPRPGDLLSPSAWDHRLWPDVDELKCRELVVRDVIHLLWQVNHTITQKLLVYTEVADGRCRKLEPVPGTEGAEERRRGTAAA